MAEAAPLPAASRVAVRLSVEEVLERLACFSIGAEELAHLALVRAALGARASEVVERFYEHLLAYPECRRILVPAALVDRLKQAQRGYLATLGEMQLSDSTSVVRYFEHRRRVGVTHHRVGLAPWMYTGAYAKLGSIALAVVTEAHPARPELVTSLHKVLALDSHLALEAYQQTREELLTVRAQRDPLTGVGNRSSTLEALEQEVARSERSRRPMAVLFVDVDHFKQVNDTRGHAAGDGLLRTVAQTLASSVRPTDVVGRYGGDEFVVGLVEADLAAAQQVSERVRASVAAAATEPPVTLSIGLAVRAEGEPLEALLTRADRAMYVAKSTGRNKVAVAEPADGEGPEGEPAPT